MELWKQRIKWKPMLPRRNSGSALPLPALSLSTSHFNIREAWFPPLYNWDPSLSHKDTQTLRHAHAPQLLGEEINHLTPTELWYGARGRYWMYRIRGEVYIPPLVVISQCSPQKETCFPFSLSKFAQIQRFNKLINIRYKWGVPNRFQV